jgi:hypothetical protein
MAQCNKVASLLRGSGALLFGALGCLGIVREVRPPSAAAPLRAAPARPDALSVYASAAVQGLESATARRPGSVELELKLARSLYLRASTAAAESYRAAFPTGFFDGIHGAGEYTAWREGWLRRDAGGDLRRALAYTQRVADRAPTRSLRLRALHIAATILRSQGRDLAALRPLRAAVRLAPEDATSRYLLGELQRILRATGRLPLNISSSHEEKLPLPPTAQTIL